MIAGETGIGGGTEPVTPQSRRTRRSRMNGASLGVPTLPRCWCRPARGGPSRTPARGIRTPRTRHGGASRRGRVRPGIDTETRDRLMGHSAGSVGERHYTAMTPAVMAKLRDAVETIPVELTAALAAGLAAVAVIDVRNP
jgi:hypothetical protein